MDYIMFNGKLSTDFNAYVYDMNVFNSAEKNVETTTVPGRNGKLILKTPTTFDNVTVEYKMLIQDGMQSNVNALKQFLLSQEGYQRLEDTIDDTVYRKGLYKESFSLASKTPNSATFKLSFDCMPQRWLKSGEITTTLTTSGTISNPTLFEAKPLIRVYGKGTLEVGSETITISKGAANYIDIDCDIQDCYEGSENRNGLVTLTDFPTLASGDTGIKLGSGITKVEITPRWWTV